MENSELELLKDKCLLYTQFIIQKLSTSPESIKGLENTYRQIQKAYEGKKIEPLKKLSAEIDEQLFKEMPLSMAIEFRNLIKEKLNINYEFIGEAHAKMLQRIIERKEIENDEQYKLVLSRVDQIFADADKSEELKSLNKLISNYESKF
ncbi:MAG TPA: hypothetical protein VGI82_12270 [Chitinophagaceae bacterium]|jgi:hypothetical protein